MRGEHEKMVLCFEPEDLGAQQRSDAEVEFPATLLRQPVRGGGCLAAEVNEWQFTRRGDMCVDELLRAVVAEARPQCLVAGDGGPDGVGESRQVERAAKPQAERFVIGARGGVAHLRQNPELPLRLGRWNAPDIGPECGPARRRVK